MKNKKVKDNSGLSAVKYVDNTCKNIVYSLEVDPLDKYHMSDQEKQFIRLYVDLGDIPSISQLMNVSQDILLEYLKSYSCQEEIKRLKQASYHRVFNSRILTIDELSSWLSSLISEDGLIGVDKKVSIGDKLKASAMLIDLHKYKNEVLAKPEVIMDDDMKDKIRKLNVEQLKKLIYKGKDRK